MSGDLREKLFELCKDNGKVVVSLTELNTLEFDYTPSAKWTQQPPTEAGWYWYYSDEIGHRPYWLNWRGVGVSKILMVHRDDGKQPLSSFQGYWMKMSPPAFEITG